MTGRETVSVRKQKIRRNRIKARLLFFLLLVVALLLVVVFAEQICPYDPNAQNTSVSLQPPSLSHLLVRTALAGICSPALWWACKLAFCLH